MANPVVTLHGGEFGGLASVLPVSRSFFGRTSALHPTPEEVGPEDGRARNDDETKPEGGSVSGRVNSLGAVRQGEGESEDDAEPEIGSENGEKHRDDRGHGRGVQRDWPTLQSPDEVQRLHVILELKRLR